MKRVTLLMAVLLTGCATSGERMLKQAATECAGFGHRSASPEMASCIQSRYQQMERDREISRQRDAEMLYGLSQNMREQAQRPWVPAYQPAPYTIQPIPQVARPMTNTNCSWNQYGAQTTY